VEIGEGEAHLQLTYAKMLLCIGCFATLFVSRLGLYTVEWKNDKFERNEKDMALALLRNSPRTDRLGL
jgi:hypothetical protein